MTTVTVLPLRSWQDPQGNAVLVFTDADCAVFLPCWDNAGEPADHICRLSFAHAAAVRSYRREFTPYQVPSHTHHSYILEVHGSDLLQEHLDYRRRTYPHSPPRHLRHFVVIAHDIYHEIVAESVIEDAVPSSGFSSPLLAPFRGTA
jgi:hypothetical protein